MDSSRLSARSGAAGLQDEYWTLKADLGIPHEPVLDVFERYCARASGELDAMEWSWKLERDRVLANRVFWLGRGGCRSQTAGHLAWLLAELGVNPAALTGAGAWRDLMTVEMERALVSYAGPNPSGARTAAIKIYLTLEDCGERVYRGLIRPLYPELPEECPPGEVRPLVCFAAYMDGRVASRAYFLYHQGQFASPVVAEYWTRLAGPRAVELAGTHPSAGFAFKGDTTNMLGLSLRPTALDSTGHPALWSSPALAPLLYAAGRNAALRERLQRVSWVTAPLAGDALRFPYVMPEMNVYVRLG